MKKITDNLVVIGDHNINKRLITLFTQFREERGYTDIRFAERLKLNIDVVTQMEAFGSILDVADFLRLCLELALKPLLLLPYLQNQDPCPIDQIELPTRPSKTYGLPESCKKIDYQITAQRVQVILSELLFDLRKSARPRLSREKVRKEIGANNTTHIASIEEGTRAVDMPTLFSLAEVYKATPNQILADLIERFVQKHK